MRRPSLYDAPHRYTSAPRRLDDATFNPAGQAGWRSAGKTRAARVADAALRIAIRAAIAFAAIAGAVTLLIAYGLWIRHGWYDFPLPSLW